MIGKATTDVERGALANIKSTLEDALEMAPAGADLTKARKLFAREKVFDDLGEFSGKAEKVKQGKGSLEQFNAGEVLRKIEHDEKFSKRFKAALSPTEQKEVKKIYTLLNEIPPLPSDAGVLGRMGGDVSQGLKFAGGASLLGMGPTAATAAGLAGSMLRPTLDTAKVVKLAMQTDEGRKILLKELTARKDKPLREIMQKVAVALSATEPVQETTRDAFGTTSTVVPFPNQQ
jgi:outer membrane lipoprotein SlyB